jgi:toxin ParE1/3/4
MPFEVRFTKGALKDLRSIHDYVSQNNSPERADYVARQIIRATLKLEEMPERVSHPPELAQLGNKSYRQIFFKPYRIFYRIRANTVYIGLIADGRRDLLPVLSRRFLKS